MLELAPQCCDAGNYLDLGRLCATNEQCWHSFRPGGTLYWFSIPYRFGWGPSALVIMNIVMMLVSALLAPFALLTFRVESASPIRLLHFFLLLALSLVIHSIFFYPTLFNSLIDGPAAACGLSGIWLFLLGKKHQSALLLALAGLFFGVCAWMRAFYLYPLAIACLAYIVCWLMAGQRKLRDLAILIAILPIFFQFYSTYAERGYWSFLDKESTNLWTSGHLHNNFKSYDTILSKNFAYHIGYCGKTYASIQHTLDEKNITGFLCFMGERSHFYLASYAPDTYLMNRHQRVYSATFLLINLLAIFMALNALLNAPGMENKTRCFLFLFVALGYAQSLIIVPEQRFVLLPTIFWLLLAGGWLCTRYTREQ